MLPLTSYWHSLDADQKAILERHLLEVPVQIGALARDLGLEVKLASLPAGISGELRPSESAPSGFKIRVNRHENKKRQRFTIAHEVAHYLLHRHHIQSGIVDDLLYRSKLSDSREVQANRLAADILMPTAQLRKALDATITKERNCLISELADTFNVSEPAMRIRLESAV